MSDFNKQMDIKSEEFLLYIMKRFKYTRKEAETHRDRMLFVKPKVDYKAAILYLAIISCSNLKEVI